MAKHSQARHLEDVIIPPIQAETSRLVEEAQLMRETATQEMQALSALMAAHEKSNQNVQDNKIIAQALATTLPPYVDKVIKVQEDFLELEKTFPKLEENVIRYRNISRQTAQDVTNLSKQVNDMKKRNEAQALLPRYVLIVVFILVSLFLVFTIIKR